MSRSDEDGRQSFILAFVLGGLAIVISLLHISAKKGKSRFVFFYVAVFVLIIDVVATLMWPRSASAQDSGFPADSGFSAQDSGDVLGKQAEDTAFVPYPDDSVDAGLCEVPK